MKRKYITMGLGVVLIASGIFFLAQRLWIGGAMLVLIGSSLNYLGYLPGRTSTVVFGHMCVLVGCGLTAWGVYLLPYSQPTLEHIVFRPLFWGLFSIFGGICAIFHGFCGCVRRGYGGQLVKKTPTDRTPERGAPAVALPSCAGCAPSAAADG
jgi:hypothetical protein